MEGRLEILVRRMGSMKSTNIYLIDNFPLLSVLDDGDIPFPFLPNSLVALFISRFCTRFDCATKDFFLVSCLFDSRSVSGIDG